LKKPNNWIKLLACIEKEDHKESSQLTKSNIVTPLITLSYQACDIPRARHGICYACKLQRAYLYIVDDAYMSYIIGHDIFHTF